MLNTTASHPQPLRPGETADPAKLANYHRARAECYRVAAECSFGPRRSNYLVLCHHHLRMERKHRAS
jgi:hypothetical protein